MEEGVGRGVEQGVGQGMRQPPCPPTFCSFSENFQWLLLRGVGWDIVDTVDTVGLPSVLLLLTAAAEWHHMQKDDATTGLLGNGGGREIICTTIGGGKHLA